MIPPTYGMIATTTLDHDGETTHEGLGIGHWDVVDCRSGERLQRLSEQRGKPKF